MKKTFKQSCEKEYRYMQTIKKVNLIFVFLFFVCSLTFSQENVVQEVDEDETNTVQEETTKKTAYKEDKTGNEETGEEYILLPAIGYSSLGVTTGLDFMYRKQNGFAALTNLNFSVPLSNLGGAIFSSELYLGYTLRKRSFYASFLAGTWLGGGVHFVGWDDHPRRKEYMNGRLLTIPALLLTFAVRNDFMYFFNDKLGLLFSHAHGLGAYTHGVAMDRKNYPAYLAYPYVFMLKLSLAIRV